MFLDPRVRGWLLLDNYLPTLSFTIMYLLIVWLGPKYMKNRQPYSCRGILVVYNLALTSLSLYMFYEVGQSIYLRYKKYFYIITDNAHIAMTFHTQSNKVKAHERVLSLSSIINLARQLKSQ